MELVSKEKKRVGTEGGKRLECWIESYRARQQQRPLSGKDRRSFFVGSVAFRFYSIQSDNSSTNARQIDRRTTENDEEIEKKKKEILLLR